MIRLVVCYLHFLITLLGSTKFMNFCGQPGARLDVDQSLYGESDASKNMLFRAMNVILFGSPDAQSRAFHKILVDQNIVDARWKQYIDKLNSDWNRYTIFSTVMLAVDISFLAVPSVETQTPATLLTYMSTLCVMGSLIITLLLVGHVNKSLRGSLTDGVCSSLLVDPIIFTPSGFFPDRNDGFCAWLGKLSLYAQSTVWPSDMGNSILCCSAVCCNFPHFWHCHHLDRVSDMGRHSHSSRVVCTGCKSYSRWVLSATLASHPVQEHEPIHCLPVEQDHRTSASDYPLSCLICMVCDSKGVSVARATL